MDRASRQKQKKEDIASKHQNENENEKRSISQKQKQKTKTAGHSTSRHIVNNGEKKEMRQTYINNSQNENNLVFLQFIPR
jgi:hypothetical protein